MKLKNALLAVLAGSAALAAPAFADNSWHRGGHRAPAHVVVRPVVAPRIAYVPAPVYYRPAPVYYTPAPVYYRPAPVYYRPAPAYYRPVPVAPVVAPAAPGISIRFHLPL